MKRSRSRQTPAAAALRFFASSVLTLPMLLATLAICWTMPPIIAHDGPATVIENLNATMLKTGPTADLLCRRATEFQAIREYRRAAADLQRAVEMDGSFEIARLELARLQLRLEKAAAESGQSTLACGEPLETIEPLTKTQDATIRTEAIALRGEIHLSYCQWEAAVSDLSSALKNRPEEIQWSLWLATAQKENGQATAGIDGLRQSLALTGSPVIRSVLCDALIVAARQEKHGGTTSSAGLLREVNQIIDQELKESRLKSAWLIRRAESMLLRDEIDAARRDLTMALEELNMRLATTRPDPALIADRERVLQLLK